ncbi:MAG: peptide chain release factor N(5)-glutamine methyltransferase [Bacteroidales bacterium]|nr:peptide chain release factor N(5)-glutamine methyltransferase [Bacteroidales bacterium]
MLLKELIDTGVRSLSVLYPDREAREMVFISLEYLIGTRRHTHIIDPCHEVAQEDVVRVRNAFDRLASGEPLQYVVGKAFFYGREFSVTPSVLIPRPETELLCRMALDTMKTAPCRPVRLLDLCTGSGCIAWTMALECPGADVVAVDVSEAALEIASTQDFSNEISISGARPPVFIHGDVLDVESLMTSLPAQGFDMILSNPPYVMDSEKALMRRNVLEHEPHLALFVPDEDPLKFYKAVASISRGLLSQTGFGLVEINEALGFETAEVFTAEGFSEVSVLKDLSDKDRYVYFRR